LPRLYHHEPPYLHTFQTFRTRIIEVPLHTQSPSRISASADKINPFLRREVFHTVST
jgi:hypothetical protein